jgi:hypothetical protein
MDEQLDPRDSRDDDGGGRADAPIAQVEHDASGQHEHEHHAREAERQVGALLPRERRVVEVRREAAHDHPLVRAVSAAQLQVGGDHGREEAVRIGRAAAPGAADRGASSSACLWQMGGNRLKSSSCSVTRLPYIYNNNEVIIVIALTYY